MVSKHAGRFCPCCQAMVISSRASTPDTTRPSLNPFTQCPPGLEELCLEFWEQRASPLRHFLDQYRDMFPAQTPPFLRLLCAFAHGKPSAGSAAAYLDAIPRLTCEHSSRQPGLRQDQGGGGKVFADQPLPIQDTCLFVPQVCCSLYQFSSSSFRSLCMFPVPALVGNSNWVISNSLAASVASFLTCNTGHPRQDASNVGAWLLPSIGGGWY